MVRAQEERDTNNSSLIKNQSAGSAAGTQYQDLDPPLAAALGQAICLLSKAHNSSGGNNKFSGTKFKTVTSAAESESNLS